MTQIVTPLGEIHGNLRRLGECGKIIEFLGVPYAEKPVGELRLKKPVAVKPWHGRVINAVERSNTPMQAIFPPNMEMMNLKDITEHEDSLYLNIWKPAIESEEKLPVMVYIHGGGFIMGTANEELYDGSKLASAGKFIMVGINYRLGPLGFMCIKDVIEPNIGLYDQQVALRWVRANIGAFGGDAGNITICGESAGAASVCWHYLQPESRACFNKAVHMSGGLQHAWAFDRDIHQLEDHSWELVESFGGNREMTHQQLISLIQSQPQEKFKIQENVGTRFGPVWEFPGQREELLAAMKEVSIPLLSTITPHEGDFFIWLSMDDKVQLLMKNDKKLLEASVTPFLSQLPEETIKAIVDFYFSQHAESETATFEALSDLMGDHLINMGHLRFLKTLQENCDAPVYFTVLEYLGKTRKLPTGFMLEIPQYVRPTHGLELPYMFCCLSEVGDEEERAYTDRLQGLLAQFVHHGEPEGVARLGGVSDAPYCVRPRQVAKAGAPFRGEAIQFWQNSLAQ